MTKKDIKLLFKLLFRSVKHPKKRVRKKNHRRMMKELHKNDVGYNDPVISSNLDRSEFPNINFKSLYPTRFKDLHLYLRQ